MTVAILDRLVEHRHLLTSKGPSWRGEQHKRLNAGHGGDAGAGKKKGRKPVVD